MTAKRHNEEELLVAAPETMIRRYVEVLIEKLGEDTTIVPEKFEIDADSGIWRFEFLCESISKGGKERVYRAVFAESSLKQVLRPRPKMTIVTDVGRGDQIILRAERLRQSVGDEQLRTWILGAFMNYVNDPIARRPPSQRGPLKENPIVEVDVPHPD